MKVYQQLNAARKEFHRLQLKKTGLNKFAGYSYFELGDFLVPALDVFDKHALCAYISFGEDVATMTIASIEDGSTVVLTSPMAEAQLKGCHPIQNLGAVETYTRRYLWVAALEIVEHDALDSSKPLETKGAVKQAALDHIGDDLGADWKSYLEGLAADVADMVAKGATNAAKSLIEDEERKNGLDERHMLYLQSKLNPTARKALGFTYVKAA